MVLGARSGNIHVHYMELRGTFIYPSMLSFSVHSAYPRPIRARSASYALYSHIHWLYQCQLFHYKLHQFIPPYPLSNIYIYIYIWTATSRKSGWCRLNFDPFRLNFSSLWFQFKLFSHCYIFDPVRLNFEPFRLNSTLFAWISTLFVWISTLFAWISNLFFCCVA